MNIQQLRESLKMKWVKYYHENRHWLVKMRIWGNYDGFRRPYSGFILATLSVLEPKLDDILPFILELNNNPDKIIAALGLNFNPEQQLHLIQNLDESRNNREIDYNTAQNKLTSDNFNFKKIEDKKNNQPAPSVSTAITKIESFPFPEKRTSTSESAEKKWNAISEIIQEKPHKPASEERMIAQLEREDEIVSLLSMCNETESFVKVSPDTETKKINSTSRRKVSNLASWIDEFCQGTGWDREEAIFIPF